MNANEWLIQRLETLAPKPYIPPECAASLRALENIRGVSDLETPLDLLIPPRPDASSPTILIPHLRPSQRKVATTRNPLSQALNTYL